MSTSYTSSYADGNFDFTIDNFSTMNLSDGTWTFTDPIGMIDTYAYNLGSAFNEIRLNAISPANNALQPNVNPSQTPRWSKLATYADGSPVFGGDNFILTVTTILKGSTTGTLRYVQHQLGVAEAVTQNASPLGTNKWSGVGQLWGFANSDASVTGSIIQGTTTAVISSSANDVKCFGSVSVIGGSAENTIIGLNSSGENDGSNATSFAGGLYSASGQLYIIFLFGANGASRTYTAGSGTDISYKYKFTKIINAGI